MNHVKFPKDICDRAKAGDKAMFCIAVDSRISKTSKLGGIEYVGTCSDKVAKEILRFFLRIRKKL